MFSDYFLAVKLFCSLPDHRELNRPGSDYLNPNLRQPLTGPGDPGRYFLLSPVSGLTSDHGRKLQMASFPLALNHKSDQILDQPRSSYESDLQRKLDHLLSTRSVIFSNTNLNQTICSDIKGSKTHETSFFKKKYVSSKYKKKPTYAYL